MNDIGIFYVIYLSLCTALLSGVRYRMFRGSLRIPEKAMYVLIVIFSLGNGFLWYVLKPGMDIAAWRTLMGLVLFCISCFVIKEPFFKHALPYSFLFVYSSAMELTGKFFYAWLAPDGSAFAQILISAAALGCSFVPVVRVINKVVVRMSAVGNDRTWGWLFYSTTTFVLMNFLLTFPASGALSVPAFLSRLLMLLGMVGILLAVMRMADSIQETEAVKSKLLLTQRQTALQQEYYGRLVRQMEEVRRTRHDLRHHRIALSAMVKNGDLSALRDYVAVLPDTEEALPVTGNMAADSLLLYYTDKAKALSVRMETDLVFSAPPMLTDSDLCVIMGNLLENALEAQEKLPAEQRYLRVAARCDESGFTLTVDNRFNGRLFSENGLPRSRKTGSGHGLGLSSVRAVCEKYGGVLRLETEGKMFLAGVFIGV